MAGKAGVSNRPALLRQLQETAVQNGTLFNTLMEVTKACSLGQITDALFEVGGGSIGGICYVPLGPCCGMYLPRPLRP